MPRNAAGVYALPDPPRVPNTVIDSPDENVTRDDIATELTNSLDRNGRGGMLAPFRIADGTLAAPGLAFLNEPGTGLYRSAAGVMDVAVQGTKVMEFTAGTVSVAVANFSVAGNFATTGQFQANGPIIFGGGAANVATLLTLNPTGFSTLAMKINTTGGLGASNGLSITAGTNNADHALLVRNASDTTTYFDVRGDGLVVCGGGNFYVTGHAIVVDSTQAVYVDGGGDTFIRELAPNVFDLVVGGTTKLRSVTAAVSNLFGQWAVNTATPFYFDGGVDTYISEIGANVLDIVVGAVTKIRMVGAVGVSNFFGPWGMVAGQPFYFDGGIDTSISESAPNLLTIVAGGATAGRFFATGFSVPPLSFIYLDDGSDTFLQEISANTMRIVTGGVERVRVTALGFTKHSDNGAYANINGNYHEMLNTQANAYACVFQNTSAAPTGLLIQYPNADPNNAVPTQFFLDCFGAGTRRIALQSNGGLLNFQANNVNLSDMTVKEYWEPYTPAQLDVLSTAVDAMDFGRYKYKDQTHNDWNHGYVAQNVREAFAASAPELVDETNWGDKDEKKMLLSVYSTDLVNINLAVARHEIRKLKEEVAYLKGKLQ